MSRRKEKFSLIPVIPSQCAHWRGNPLDFHTELLDCRYLFSITVHSPTDCGEVLYTQLWNRAHIPKDTATTARSPFTVLRTAPGDRGIFPRPKKVSPGHFLTLGSLGPAFQIRPHQQKTNPIRMDGVCFLAEKEGFEPSIPFWGIHDFQSCALGQLRDLSKWRRSIDLLILHQHPRFVNTFFQKFQIIFYRI